MGKEEAIDLEKADKINVENGAARGIWLKNGDQIEAKQLVVADVGIPQLMLGWLGGMGIARGTRYQAYSVMSEDFGLPPFGKKGAIKVDKVS